MQALESAARPSIRLLIAALAAALALTSLQAAASAADGPSLMVSTRADRSAARSLSGATLQGPQYIFVTSSRVNRVVFYLDDPQMDGRAHRHEDDAPFDLAGGSTKAANAWYPGSVPAGTHSLTAKVTMRGGAVRIIRATFTTGAPAADPAPAPAPPPPPAPAPDPDPAPAPAPAPPPPPAPAPPPPPAPSTGFPDAASTGPRDGVALRPVGAQTVTTDGVVLEDLDVSGCINVHADDVTIRNVRVRCGGTHVIRFHDGADRGLVEHVEIDGRLSADNGIKGGNGLVVRHTDIHSSVDGLKVASNSTYEFNWIHDLYRTETSHNDGMQMMEGRNVTIRGNTIDLELGKGMNACIWVKEDFGPISDVRIIGNHVDGTGYQIRIGSGANVSATDNVHTRAYNWGPYWGYLTITNPRWDDGTTIDPSYFRR